MIFNLLIGIPVIGRDANGLVKSLLSVLGQDAIPSLSLDILMITRVSDVEPIRDALARAKSLTNVPFTHRLMTTADYEIADQHNLMQLAAKRRYILNHATRGGYDALLFLDADIIMRRDVLRALLNCGSPVTIAPYRPRWGTGRFVCDEAGRVFDMDPIIQNATNRSRCFRVGGGGFGCTLIRRSAFKVPVKVGSHPIGRSGKVIEGEDIGFFQNCKVAGVKVCCVVSDGVTHEPVNQARRFATICRLNSS